MEGENPFPILNFEFIILNSINTWGRSRTDNLLLFRQALYRLSYPGVTVVHRGIEPLFPV